MTRWPLVLCTVLLVAGCGGGADGDKSSAEAPVAASPSAAPDNFTGPSKATLASALLTVQDFPTGWTKVPAKDDAGDKENDDSNSKGPCNEQLRANDDKFADAVNKVEVEFERNDESISESIGAYASAEELAALTAGFAEVIRECGELVLDVEGRELSGRVGETSFPKLGDETVGYTVTFDVEGYELFLNQVFVRRGALLLQFFSYDLLSNDTYRLVETMEKAVAKVDRIVPA